MAARKLKPIEDRDPQAAAVLAAFDRMEEPHLEELRKIGAAIGYGRAIQILGEAWGEMLEREYGLPPTRGQMSRRRDIEYLESVIRANPIRKPSGTSEQITEYARRYAYLRGRDLDAIDCGGVFAGLTPANVVLSGDHLDAAIDTAIAATEQASPRVR